MRYLEIVDALAAKEVRYLIVGGVAVILHGVPRTTYDLDLLIDFEPRNVTALLEALEALGYRPRAPVAASELAIESKRAEWIRDKDMKAFSFWHPQGGEVDILIDAPIDYAEAAKDQIIIEAQQTPIAIASIDALIRLKEAAGREQDQSDIAALRRVRQLSEEDEP